MNYQAHISKTLETATTRTFDGLLVDSVFDGFVVFIPCFCVHDAPDSPCPCMDTYRLLIPKDKIVGKILERERKSSDGESLSRVTVERDAMLILEKSAAIRADQAAMLLQATHKSDKLHKNNIRLPPYFPFPWPPVSTGPTVPIPDPENPEIVYVVPWGAIVKYGVPALIGAGGAIIGGWLGGDDNNCKTKSTETVVRNPDGSTTTTTITETVCA